MSNQVARNSTSSYYVEDNHLFVDNSLTRWDNDAQLLDNSLAIIDDAGLLTVPSIDVSGSIDADILCAQTELQTDIINEKTPDAGVLIDGKY